MWSMGFESCGSNPISIIRSASSTRLSEQSKIRQMMVCTSHTSHEDPHDQILWPTYICMWVCNFFNLAWPFEETYNGRDKAIGIAGRGSRGRRWAGLCGSKFDAAAGDQDQHHTAAGMECSRANLHVCLKARTSFSWHLLKRYTSSASPAQRLSSWGLISRTSSTRACTQKTEFCNRALSLSLQLPW